MSILDDARAVITNGPVCDPCLGRVSGRSNGEECLFVAGRPNV